MDHADRFSNILAVSQRGFTPIVQSLALVNGSWAKGTPTCDGQWRVVCHDTALRTGLPSFDHVLLLFGTVWMHHPGMFILDLQNLVFAVDSPDALRVLFLNIEQVYPELYAVFAPYLPTCNLLKSAHGLLALQAQITAQKPFSLVSTTPF